MAKNLFVISPLTGRLSSAKTKTDTCLIPVLKTGPFGKNHAKINT